VNLKKNLDSQTNERASVPEGLTEIDGKKPETKYITLLYCTYACSIALSYLIPQAAL
jgi:hypothetical protein